MGPNDTQVTRNGVRADLRSSGDPLRPMHELSPEQRRYARAGLMLELGGIAVLIVAIAASMPWPLILLLGALDLIGFVHLRRTVGPWLDPDPVERRPSYPR